MERRSSTLAQMAGAPRQSTLTSYMPTLRNRLAAAIMGDRPSGSFLGDLVEKTIGPTVGSPSGPTAIDFTPFGLPFMADEAGRKMARPGVKGKASGLFDMGLAMIPVPAAVGAVKSGAKTVARQGEKLATKALADYVAGEAAKKGEQAASKGFKAYHGSPHKFDAFDLSKIGTGEGAQAFGHGLYFAENENVARGYRDALSDENWLVNGAAYNAADPSHRAAEKLYRFEQRGGDKYSLMQDLLAKRREYEAKGTDWANLGAREIQDEINALASGKVGGFQSSPLGHMYEVNINANPEHFLDWDAPLGQQSEHVRRALGWTPEQEAAHASAQREDIDNLLAALTSDADYVETRSPTPKGVPPLDATGADIVKGNSVFGNPDAPNHSQALRSAGIPGIKYLDQGSRGAGEGTRNYVVFDPATIAILRRYGILGPVLGGGAVAASQYQPPQQAKKPTEY